MFPIDNVFCNNEFDQYFKYGISVTSSMNQISINKKFMIIVALVIMFFTFSLPIRYDNNHDDTKLTAKAQDQQKSENTVNDDNSGNSLTMPDLFSKVEKSVVQVTDVDTANLLGARLGSGFIYDNKGHIITNYHVVAGSRGENLQITFLDGTTYHAKVVGGDPFSDLAVLQTATNVQLNKLVPLHIGNSTSLRVGEKVVAIGNPFGLSGSMTDGIVSGLGRMLPSSEQSQTIPQPPSENDQLIPRSQTDIPTTFSIPDIIQTDAAINPGNSGGPLLNMRGEVIGINTAIFSNTGVYSGVGFAIPSNTIKKVVPSLIATGSYTHPYLGVLGTNVTPEIAGDLGLQEPTGFLVTGVTTGSPAYKSGIHAGSSLTDINQRELPIGGDIILEIDDKKVRKIDDILTYLEREKEVGDIVQLTVLRNGMTDRIPVTLGARPSSQEFPDTQMQSQSETLPPGKTPEKSPYNDLYNECAKLAGNQLCDFLFRR
jgi:S1-C subfamily serine protease